MEINKKHKITKKYIIWRAIQILLVLVPLKVFSNQFTDASFTVLSPLLLIIFIYLVISILVTNFSFNEKEFNMKYGILFRSSKTIKYNKLQNLELTAGPLMRILGLYKINFWTASIDQLTIHGGSSRTKPDTIVYIRKNNALWLENFINENIEK